MKKPLGLLLICITANVMAAPIAFYPSLSGQSSGDTGEGRWTYFEALNDVTITQLGVMLNPTSSADRFLWEIYSTDTSGALQSLMYQETVTYVDDDLLTTKDIAANISIAMGNYVIGLTTLDSPWQIMGGPNTVSGGYYGPGFTTADGSFRLWDAAASSPTAPLQSGNSGLIPAFSVNIAGYQPNPTPVPEPGTILLMAAAGLGLIGVRQSRKP